MNLIEPKYPNKKASKISKILVLSAISFLIYSYLTLDYYIPLIHYILGSIVIILGIIPSLIYLKQVKMESVPLLPLVGLFYAFSFGLVGFENVFRNFYVTQTALTSVLILAIMGLISLYTGYYLVGKNLFRKIKPFHLNANIDNKKISFYGWLLELIYIFYLLFLRDKLFLDNFDQLLDIVSLLGKGFLFYLILKGEMTKTKTVLFSLLTIFEFIIAFTSGHLAWVISLSMFFSVIYLFIKKKIPIFVAIFVIAFFYTFQSVKADYRLYIWGLNNQSYNLFDRLKIFTDLAIESKNGSGNISTFSLTLQRIDNLGTTAVVWMKTPSEIPFQYGESYAPLLTKFIPRFLWPSKPKENFGNIWAKWYDLLQPNDYVTSYNLPWLTEFYMNFGIMGVLLGMFMVGVIFRFLVNKFCNSPTNIFEALFGIILTIGLFVQESNLSLVLGGVIVLYIPLYLIMKFIAQVNIKV